MGHLSEDEFLKTSRPWPRYATDYKPLVDFAVANQWPVVASNVPRPFASEVSKTGFAALDSKTGKRLWRFNCGAGANAMPVSYTVNGKQHIAMGCGGNTQLDFKRGNSLFVFAVD